jgi:hypothetical protein
VGAGGHPVDEPGGEQLPLEHGGVVVEVEGELGHPGLGVGARVLVDTGQDRAGGGVEPRGEGSSGGGGGRVATGAGREGHRSGQAGQSGQTGRGQGPVGAVEHGGGGRAVLPDAGVGSGVAVDLAHLVGGLVGEQRGELARGEGGRGVGDHHRVEVAHRSGGEGGQGDRLGAVGARRGGLGVGHPLVGQGRLPGRRGRVGRPGADQEHVEAELGGGGGRHCRGVHHRQRGDGEHGDERAGCHHLECGPV